MSLYKSPIVLFVASFVFLLSLFTYRLSNIPDGLTIDEAAFGLNGSLLSQTLRDENGRFLPIFVLSIHDTDWRQPITQYLIATSFKIFGPSVFNMRLVSVITIIFSVYLMFFLGKLVFKSSQVGLISTLVFIFSPVTLIFAHLGLDPITSVPFVLLWLIFLYQFQRKLKVRYLILSGLALGIGLYAYKGMRATVPVWSLLTLAYLYYLSDKKIIKFLNSAKYFLIGLIPFFLIIPLLESKYPGAVLNNQSLFSGPLHDFLYFYLGNFDLGMWFVKGDKELLYSTQIHGMFLVTSAPLFFYGLYKALSSKINFLKLIVASLLLGPLFYGSVGSVAAHRLLFILPLYSILWTFGFINLLVSKNILVKGLLILMGLLMITNYLFFLNYYFGQYSIQTKHLFYSSTVDKPYKLLSEQVTSRNLTPFLTHEIYQRSTTHDHEMFLRSIYFTKSPELWSKPFSELPNNSVILTEKAFVEGLEPVDTGYPNYYLYIKSF